MPITRSKHPAKKPASLPRSLGLPSRPGKPQPAAAHKSAPPPRASSRRTAGPSAQRGAILGNISPERKVDIAGVIMVFLGLLTMLSLFSVNRGGLTGSWIGILALGFGWGVYLLPAGLVILGAWLVARKVERLPELNIERIVGILLLFVGLLVTFHGLSGSAATAMERAAQGLGGGYLGAVLQRLLVLNIGGLATAILLIGWLLVGLAMTLDLSMQEMFRWVGPLWKRLVARLERAPAVPAPPAGAGAVPSEPAEGPGFFGKSPPGDFRPLPPRAEAPLPAARPVPGVAVRTGVPSAPRMPWVLPRPGDVLEAAQAQAVNEEFVEKRARLIEETLASFGAPSQVVEISRGPTVTMFGVEPLFVETRNGRTRVRVSKIVSLADDLALALAAPRVRIQAPVPGRGFVGIEVPNEEMTLVTMREVVESEVFGRIHSPLRIALGKDVAGHPKGANLEAMPHLLIAGTTGSGKSVCVNGILSCLLMNNTPDDLRLILVDPKRVELTGYNGIPHLLAPVVVEIERVVGALQWMTREMDKRYHTFAETGARNIQDYNARMTAQGGRKLPYLVVVIDELADLMMISPDETERTITRLAQLARATGIHMIIATQRPSVDVLTGLIKANFPARIAFAVASNVDSRVILDQPGAERLLGRGDMLFQAPDSPAPVRLQGVFVSDVEINRLVDYWRAQAGASSPYAAAAAGASTGPAEVLPQGMPLKPADFGGRQVPMFEDMSPESKGDPLLAEATDLVRREGRASVSMLQRKLRIGYTRAARLVDTLEEKGIVGPPQGGTQLREVLDYGPAAPPKEE